jgi:hypothetical protein
MSKQSVSKQSMSKQSMSEVKPNTTYQSRSEAEYV